MLDNLEAFPTAGTINTGMDLGGREQEPTQQPKALAGLDDTYQREYIYNSDGTLLGVKLRHFFQLGEGALVTAEELDSLWQTEFAAAGELDPKLLEPTQKKDRELKPKVN